MADLSNHLEIVSILLHRHDPAFLPGLYVDNWGHPNQLFYVFSCALGWVLGAEWAVKCVIVINFVFLFVGSARLIRRGRGSLWAVTLLAPVTTGFLYMWGLVTNLLGLTVLLWVLPGLEDFERQPTLKRGAGVFATLVLMFFAHESTMIVYAGASGLLALVFLGGWRKFIVQTTPFVGAVVLHQWETYFHQVQSSVPSPPVFLSAGELVEQLVFSLWGPNPPSVLNVMSFLSLMVLATLVIHIKRRPWRRWVVRNRLLLLGLSCLAIYFLMPYGLHGATLLNARFASAAWVLLVISMAPRRDWIGFKTSVLWGSVPVAAVLSILPRFLSADEQMGELKQLIPLVVPGSTIMAINADQGDDRQSLGYFGADSYISSVVGGRSGTNFTESPVSPANIPAAQMWGPTFGRVLYFGGGLRPGQDFQYFRYVLVRTVDPVKARVLTKAMVPEGHFVANSGDWTLLETNLPLKPVESLTPADDPKAKSLSQRVQCFGYLVHDLNWIASEQNYADLKGCMPMKRPRPGDGEGALLP